MRRAVCAAPLAVLVFLPISSGAWTAEGTPAVLTSARAGEDRQRTLAAAHWDVKSPDGRNAIDVVRTTEGRLVWRVMRGAAAMLEDSPLGIRRSDQFFEERLTLVAAAAPIDIRETWQATHGKRKVHTVQGRERHLTFSNASGRKIEIILRAHNDGVAIRYRFPETDTIAKTITEELTGFAVPAGSTAWIQPQQPVGQYAPAYEELYKTMPAGASAPEADGWAFPALFKTPSSAWMLISESGMDGGYCGSHLAQSAAGGVYRLKFPDPAEGRGVGLAQPRGALPWTLPWRVVMLADSAAQLMESDLVSDLSAPTRQPEANWVQPGRAAWSWWSESDSPKSAARLNAFTDLAADMGWEYNLVDANWNLMTQGTIADVVAHAEQKKVGLLLWYNSGGPHNNVTEAPRERMFDRTIRRAEMGKLRDWGVKGIKVDFWQSDKQDRMLQYRAVLQDAAEFHLLVDVHGATIPRGWEREFPHLIGIEAVAGAEQYKFRKDYPEQAAWQNTVLPFTRNVLGTMDYTPVTFSDHQYPHLTTFAHELALSVVFEAGVQHFADGITAYASLPEAPKEFLKAVPAAWDETRGIAGEPGRAVVVARRAGDVWYVGGLAANDAQTLRIPLAFLGSGPWHLTQSGDGATDRTFATTTGTVTARDTLDVSLRARGGVVIRLTR